DDDGVVEIRDSALSTLRSPAFIVPGVRKIRARVADKDGGETTSIVSINVINAAPTITSFGLPLPPAASSGLPELSSQGEPAAIFTKTGSIWLTGMFSDGGSGHETYRGTARIRRTDVAAGNPAGDVVMVPAILRPDNSFELFFAFASGGTYAVTATISDNLGGAAESQAVIVQVVELSLSNATVPENAGANAPVGSLAVSSGEDDVTFSLVDGDGSADNGLFDVVGGTLVARGSFDYETMPTVYSVRVRAVGATSGTTERAFTVSVTDGPDGLVTVAAGGTVTENGGRSGSLQLVKRGAGKLVLAGANSHSGGLLVEEGEVVIRHVAALNGGRLEVRPGARVTIETGLSRLVVSGLALDPAGRIDLKQGGLVIEAGGFDIAALKQAIAAGSNGGDWLGTRGITSSVATAAAGRAVGYAPDTTGRMVVAFAAPGDVDLNGEVDLLDLLSILGSGTYDTGTPSIWNQGDFNADGQTDLLDVLGMLGSGAYDQGNYLAAAAVAPTTAAAPAPTLSTKSPTSQAFGSLEPVAAADTPSGTTGGSTTEAVPQSAMTAAFAQLAAGIAWESLVEAETDAEEESEEEGKLRR
ncbi:MAG: autotransporter-associated beta strand repeat-containing protein, partial [Planctomycetia bacterium]